MEISIFKEVTTEGVITSIEENSKKYHEGFYADMNNAPERKLVKESAAEIGGMIKELKASRIKITKANTAAVNKEHDAIVSRLETANLPFTLLIDEYKAERAKILAAEKLVIELREAAKQKEDDHEIAVLMNKTYEFDKAEELRIKQERDQQIKDSAVAYALDVKKREDEQLERDKINTENARLADVEHVRGINIAILTAMIDCDIPKYYAQQFIKKVARKEINNITINY